MQRSLDATLLHAIVDEDVNERLFHLNDSKKSFKNGNLSQGVYDLLKATIVLDCFLPHLHIHKPEGFRLTLDVWKRGAYDWTISFLVCPNHRLCQYP